MKLFESIDFFDHINNNHEVFWIGALSFEARSNGSVLSLTTNGIDISSAFALDYQTSLSPRSIGEQNRAINKREFFRLLGSKAETTLIAPYRYAEFIGVLENLFNLAVTKYSKPWIIVDITCLTKIHTLSLAYWLLTRKDKIPVTLAYSQPEYYGSVEENSWGKGKWLDILQVRLDLDSTESYASTSIIAILGHEGDRMRLALNEADPDEALIVKAIPLDPFPSTLSTITYIQNSWLIKGIQDKRRPRFNIIEVELSDLEGLSQQIISYSLTAKNKRARIVLCPFGPKPFVFVTGYSALSICPEQAWLYYPIPLSYDPEYSSGYKKTLWITL